MPHAVAELLDHASQRFGAQPQGKLLFGVKVVGYCLALGTAGHILAMLPDSFDDGLNQSVSALYAGHQLTTADHLSVV